VEPKTFLKAMLIMWGLGAGAGYALRKSGIDELVMAKLRARVDGNNRRYARIMGEEIGSRIIILSSAPVVHPILDPEREPEAGGR
jgi:hypothetical protein